MTTRSSNTSHRHNPAHPLDCELDPIVLLQEMLSRIQRAAEVPLQFGIDSPRIAQSALRAVRSGGRARRRRLRDWQTITRGLDELVSQLLLDERPCCQAAEDPCCSEPPEVEGSRASALMDPETMHPLAVWLQGFHATVLKVTPQALDIVRLRAAGYTDREIADQLRLGLRLVRRILSDVRARWNRSRRETPPPGSAFLE